MSRKPFDIQIQCGDLATIPLCLPVVKQRWFRLGEPNYPLPCRPNGFIFFSLVIFKNPIFECALQERPLKDGGVSTKLSFGKIFEEYKRMGRIPLDVIVFVCCGGVIEPDFSGFKGNSFHRIYSQIILRLQGGKGESSLEIRYLFSFIDNPMCIPLTSGSPQQ